ncbi:hypothetical protein [Streptomyces sp. NPDC054808]
MMSGMGWEGITALTGAATALFALVVGWLQFRAANTTAQQNYLAALDAVQASGREAHAQWLRGTRRDAYATFLLAAARTLEVARHLADDAAENRIAPDQRGIRLTELEAQVSQLRNAAAIVSLEGPENIAGRADVITDMVVEDSIVARKQFAACLGWYDFTTMAGDAGDRERGLSLYYTAARHMHGARQSGTGDIRGYADDDLSEDVRAARDALHARRVGLPLRLWKLAESVEDYVCGHYEEQSTFRAEQAEVIRSLRDQFISDARWILGEPNAAPR